MSICCDRAGAEPGTCGTIADGTMLLGGDVFCGAGGLNSGAGTFICLAACCEGVGADPGICGTIDDGTTLLAGEVFCGAAGLTGGTTIFCRGVGSGTAALGGGACCEKHFCLSFASLIVLQSIAQTDSAISASRITWANGDTRIWSPRIVFLEDAA